MLVSSIVSNASKTIFQNNKSRYNLISTQITILQPSCRRVPGEVSNWKWRRTPRQLRNADQPAGRRLSISQLCWHLNISNTLPKQSTPLVIHLLILPKPLVFLLGSIIPLFAQNLSTPLLMTFPKFLTLSSSTEDVSTFSKPFAETPLKLFTLYTF